MSVVRTCAAGHRIDGENAMQVIRLGKFTGHVCRACARANRLRRHARARAVRQELRRRADEAADFCRATKAGSK